MSKEDIDKLNDDYRQQRKTASIGDMRQAVTKLARSSLRKTAPRLRAALSSSSIPTIDSPVSENCRYSGKATRSGAGASDCVDSMTGSDDSQLLHESFRRG